MHDTAHCSSLARFESFEVNLRSGELYKNEEKVKLPEQSFRILVMLLERPGEVIPRNEIQKRLWPNDTVVEFENSINSAIKKLRLALGDVAANPRYIETLARRGYRWKGQVEWVAPSPGKAQAPATTVTPEAQPVSPYLAGKRVSHYRVLEILGGGGMGVIYRAEDIKLGRAVALKFLPDELTADPVALERFEREARAMSALDHSNICAVHEFGEHEGRPFIVMQLLRGQTLCDRIASAPSSHAPFTTAELVALALQIADGLSAAHQQGIIHRDIKPSNVFITSHGAAKILDFGLAKQAKASEPLPRKTVATASLFSTQKEGLHHPTLTRTGVAVGTAAYMSPEQVRGEALDARSDLFSFGLVLYEMASGHQAFEGSTAAAVNEAILSRDPLPARQLNPQISPDLERVIAKALEKDRRQRYQTAAEMRAELVRLQEKHYPLKWALAGSLTLALFIFVLLWSEKQKQASLPEIRETRITASSSDLPVTGQAISPNGKYLAYSDARGIHLKLLATGETQTLSDLASEAGIAWFPDSARFLASQSFMPGIWEFSVIGGAPRQLLKDGTVGGVSPDGSLVSYTTNKGRVGDREIWLIGSDGMNPRTFLSVDEDASLQVPLWTPDGRRMYYGLQRQTANNVELSIETRDLVGGSPVVLYSEFAQNPEQTRFQDLVWLPGGRLILSLTDSDFLGLFTARFNLWELRVDSATGQPAGPMRRLTNWRGGAVSTVLVATSNGKTISTLRMAPSESLLLADLSADGKHISNSRPFTTADARNYAPAWAADSQSVFFESDRDGRLQVFRQQLVAEMAQPISLGSAETSIPVVSPDGSFLLYLSTAHSAVGASSTPAHIMRVPMNGGASQLVLTARIYDAPRCTRSPATFCAIAEPSGNRGEIIFTAFDPVRGRGRELVRFAADPNADYAWDLSPNGHQIAILKRVPRSDGKIYSSVGPVHILSSDGKPPREVYVRERNIFSEHIDWTADGKSLLLVSHIGKMRELRELLVVDLSGNANILLQQDGLFRAVPSPDGRRLAILRRAANNNVWLLENF